MARNLRLEIIFNIVGFSTGYFVAKSFFDWKIYSSKEFKDLQETMKKADEVISKSQRLGE